MTERESGNQEHSLTGDGFDDTVLSGSSTERTFPSPTEDQDGLPDLSAIQADDALLDALGGPDPQVSSGLGDEELNALLLAWRRDIDSEPLAELVDTPSAVTTIKTAALAKRNGSRGRRRRMLVPVAAAAAVLAIGFTGTALAARDAQPGDTLWGLSKVLYADHARSVEAAASVRTELQEAQLALAQQRYDDARKALAQAEQALAEVTAEEELAELRARHTQLMAQLDEPEQQPQQPPATTTSTPDSGSSSSEDTSPTGSTPPPASSVPNVPPDSTTSTDPTTPTTTSTTTPPPSSSTGDSTGSESESGGRQGAAVSELGEEPVG